MRLGDHVSRGRTNPKTGIVIGYPKNRIRYYRVVGLNPSLKLQEVLGKNSWEELGKIEEFDWLLAEKLQPLFPPEHFAHWFFGGDYSCYWTGDF